MKLINSRVDIVNPTGYTLQDIYKQIELAGRTCYKSEDKITDDSAKEFVDRMIASKHYAMLEHGTVYLQINGILNFNDYPEIAPNDFSMRDLLENKYTRIHINYNENDATFPSNTSDYTFFVTTNYRVIIENGWEFLLKHICEPTNYHYKRVTAKFICDRGVSHELVRHRVFSFAQESTRYCNYSKDKFGNELTFIINDELHDDENATGCDYHNLLENIELTYLQIIKDGYTAQQARTILPNGLKTEVVITGFESDWDHFFELRCAKAAHPDMQKLANELKQLFANGLF